MQVHIVIILVLVEITIANVESTTKNITSGVTLNESKKESNGTDNTKGTNLTDLIKLNVNNTRRKDCDKTSKPRKVKDRSTSSSSGEKFEEGESNGDKESLDLSGSDQGKTDEGQLPPNPNATGWRQWHRRCTPCLEDMIRKWRDPSISWICGGYQRARRSFKSECMMYYRNCQDGTMFTKIHEHRCVDKDIGVNRGKHWFYDYKVVITDESSETDADSPTIEDDESDSDLLFRRDIKNDKLILKKGSEPKKSLKTKKANSEKIKRSDDKFAKGNLKKVGKKSKG